MVMSGHPPSSFIFKSVTVAITLVALIRISKFTSRPSNLELQWPPKWRHFRPQVYSLRYSWPAPSPFTWCLHCGAVSGHHDSHHDLQIAVVFSRLVSSSFVAIFPDPEVIWIRVRLQPKPRCRQKSGCPEVGCQGTALSRRDAAKKGQSWRLPKYGTGPWQLKVSLPRDHSSRRFWGPPQFSVSVLINKGLNLTNF